MAAVNGAARGLCERCFSNRAVRDRYPLPRRRPDDPCRHCGLRKACSGVRKLCHTCAKDPALDAAYPRAVAVAEVWTACRHCRTGRPARHKRGLCQPCYHNPPVRALYPSTSKYATHTLTTPEVEREDVGLTPPPAPTDHPPGSPGKVEVLAERFARRVSLWHADDAPAPPACLS